VSAGDLLGRRTYVIGMVVVKTGATLLVVTEKGMGKRSDIDAYRLQRRGGKGVINVRTSDKAGKVVAIREVLPGDELMVITRNGVVNRQSVDGIRVIGRNTQGVRLINLGPKDVVMDVAKVVGRRSWTRPVSRSSQRPACWRRSIRTRPHRRSEPATAAGKRNGGVAERFPPPLCRPTVPEPALR
jgi:hypothetical protein